MSDDDLITRARQRAESGGVDESWGTLLDLEEDETFDGRYRGATTDPDNGRAIWPLWDQDDELRWSRNYASLEREMEKAAPSIGDRIVIYRGDNYKTAYDGDKGPKGRSFGVVCEPSDRPLPASVDASGDTVDGIPF
jgi:hypothetical protein